MFSNDDPPTECPLCMEQLELDDINFFPCECGYQVCHFCWHRIRTDENGRCPQCRKPYTENPAEYRQLSQEEIQQWKARKRQKEKEKRHKGESRRHLADVRVLQRNLVFLTGLSAKMADAEVMKRQEYFGRFGKLQKVVVNSHTVYSGSQGPAYCAYLTFSRNEDAKKCVLQTNSAYIDGRLVKAAFGTNKYCSSFIKNVPCTKADCMYLHEYGDETASFTKQDMQLGKHTQLESEYLAGIDKSKYGHSPSQGLVRPVAVSSQVNTRPQPRDVSTPPTTQGVVPNSKSLADKSTAWSTANVTSSAVVSESSVVVVSSSSSALPSSSGDSITSHTSVTADERIAPPVAGALSSGSHRKGKAQVLSRPASRKKAPSSQRSSKKTTAATVQSESKPVTTSAQQSAVTIVAVTQSTSTVLSPTAVTRSSVAIPGVQPRTSVSQSVVTVPAALSPTGGSLKSPIATMGGSLPENKSPSSYNKSQLVRTVKMSEPEVRQTANEVCVEGSSASGNDGWETTTQSLAELLDKELGDLLQPAYSVGQEAASLNGVLLSSEQPSSAPPNYAVQSEQPSFSSPDVLRPSVPPWLRSARLQESDSSQTLSARSAFPVTGSFFSSVSQPPEVGPVRKWQESFQMLLPPSAICNPSQQLTTTPASNQQSNGAQLEGAITSALGSTLWHGASSSALSSLNQSESSHWMNSTWSSSPGSAPPGFHSSKNQPYGYENLSQHDSFSCGSSLQGMAGAPVGSRQNAFGSSVHHMLHGKQEINGGSSFFSQASGPFERADRSVYSRMPPSHSAKANMFSARPTGVASSASVCAAPAPVYLPSSTSFRPPPGLSLPAGMSLSPGSHSNLPNQQPNNFSDVNLSQRMQAR